MTSTMSKTLLMNIVLGILALEKIEAQHIVNVKQVQQNSSIKTWYQALGSEVLFEFVVTPPPTNTTWEVHWILFDGRINHILGTIQVAPFLHTQYWVNQNQYSQRVYIRIPSYVYESKKHELKSTLSLSNLAMSDNGSRVGVLFDGKTFQLTERLNVTECAFIQDKAIIMPKSGECGFQCARPWKCQTGYSPSNVFAAMCMANARWNLTYDSCIKTLRIRAGESRRYPRIALTKATEELRKQLQKWNFYPNSPTLNFAVGYTGLELHVVMDVSNNISSCSWRYNGEWNGAEFFSKRQCWDYEYFGVVDQISCYLKNGLLSTAITFNEPLAFGKKSVGFECDSILYLELELSIVYCPTRMTPDGITIRNEREKCEFNCSAFYSCPSNLVAAGQGLAFCTGSAQWSVNVENNCIQNKVLRRIEKVPINSFTYAVGLTHLLIHIEFKALGQTNCAWKYGGELDDVVLFTEDGSCRKRILVGENETITCNRTGKLATSNLTFHESLPSGEIRLILDCDGVYYLDDLITFKYCTETQEYAVISAPSLPCKYSCKGNYRCLPGFVQYGPSDVVCTESGLWNVTDANCVEDGKVGLYFEASPNGEVKTSSHLNPFTVIASIAILTRMLLH